MKKLTLLTMLFALLLVACNSKDEPKKPFQLDPNATINIKPDMRGWNKAPQRVATENPKHLSPLEIVKRTIILAWKNEELSGKRTITRGFAKHQRDTLSNPPMLKMYGTDIIDQDGNYATGFINGKDFILTADDAMTDTIGYIPNSVIKNARGKIKQAYDNGNNEEVYRLFNEAFTFLPVTGAEWRELKKQEQN